MQLIKYFTPSKTHCSQFAMHKPEGPGKKKKEDNIESKTYQKNKIETEDGKNTINNKISCQMLITIVYIKDSDHGPCN
jgi:hypothetical protein